MKKIKKFLAPLLLSVALLCPQQALADDADDLESQLEELGRQAEAQQEETARIEARIGTVSDQIRVLSAEVDEADADYRAVKSELDATLERIDANQELLEATEKELRERTNLLETRVKNIYIHGQISYIDALFGAQDFSDFLTRMDLLKRVLKNDYNLVQRVAESKRVVESARAELEKEREAESVLVAEAEDRAMKLQLRKQEKDRLLERMENDRELSERAYEEILAASREIENLIRQGQIRNQYPVTASGSGGMIWPVIGEITSPYGWRIHPITGDSRYHSGMDIGADYGDPILAAAAGTVSYSGWISGYGYTVIIEHGGGISTLYGHNQSLAVGEGQAVAQGEVIAYCGSTGNSTGPHCHFEVRINGEPTEPLDYL